MRVARENTMPPDTGEGMQNFWSHAILRVMAMPVSKARAPTPADWSMSSVIVCMMFCVVLSFGAQN